MDPARQVLGIHARLYDKLHALIPDLDQLQPGASRKSRSTGWMDLHLDVLDFEELQGRRFLRISLAHNHSQNGDVMADPDMELRVSLDPAWPAAEALTYQLDGLGLHQVVYPQPGLVVPRLKRELNAFLEGWLGNLKDQGHKLAPGPCGSPEAPGEDAACQACARGDAPGGNVDLCRLRCGRRSCEREA